MKESFIIYNCENENLTKRDDKTLCMSYYNYKVNYSSNEALSPEQTPSPSFCNRLKTRNKDNICCFYNEKNNTGNISPSCIELNK